MISDIDDINTKLTTTLRKLRLLYQGQHPIDKKQLANFQIDILNFIADVATFLNNKNPLSPWKKRKLVGAVNAVSWGWFYLALGRIELAIIDESKVDPNIKYDEEIIDLTLNKLINYIDQLKLSIQQNINFL